MQKQKLSGTLDEQCAFLYDLAQEKINEGNYTGAAHNLEEIAKHNPAFRDTTTLLAWVKRQKSQQRALLFFGFLGATVFVGIGSSLQVSNDFILLAMAVAGAVVGYFGGLLLYSQSNPSRSQKSGQQP